MIEKITVVLIGLLGAELIAYAYIGKLSKRAILFGVGFAILCFGFMFKKL